MSHGYDVIKILGQQITSNGKVFNPAFNDTKHTKINQEMRALRVEHIVPQLLFGHSELNSIFW